MVACTTRASTCLQGMTSAATKNYIIKSITSPYVVKSTLSVFFYVLPSSLFVR